MRAFSDQYSQKSNTQQKSQSSNNLLHHPYSLENSAFASWYNQLPVPFPLQNVNTNYHTQATDKYNMQVAQSHFNPVPVNASPNVSHYQQRRDARPTITPRNDFQPNFMRDKNDVQVCLGHKFIYYV